MDMRQVSCWFALVTSLLLGGCAGTAVEPNADPLTKLNDAELLFRQQDQPVLAERLIRQAMDIYAQREDPHGLGNAYREYADLLRSDAVSGKWAAYYREHGFQDRSVTYQNRMAKSAEYYNKGLGYYARAEARLRDERKFGALTNVYFNMAMSYYQLQDKEKACAYFDRTIDAYKENIHSNPNAKPYSPTGSVPGLVNSLKKKAGCA
jgi:tetratricopeptide (TPR) repeat protein